MEIMKPIKIKMDETEQDFCIKSFFKTQTTPIKLNGMFLG